MSGLQPVWLGPDQLTTAIFDFTGDGMVVFDPAGVVHSVNQAAVTIFGHLSHELIGQPIGKILAEPQAMRLLRCAPAPLRVKLSGRRRNGSRFPLQMNAGPLPVPGKADDLVQTILRTAGCVGMQILAEGVATAAQAECLRKPACTAKPATNPDLDTAPLG